MVADAEDGEQLFEKIPLQQDALFGTALGFEFVAQGEVALVQVAQGTVGTAEGKATGGFIEGFALGFGFFPLGLAGGLFFAVPGLDGVGKVTLENFSEIMGAEEFVVVGQANKGGGAVLYCHGAFPV